MGKCWSAGIISNDELGESRGYSVARYIRIVKVTGSNPVCSTNAAGSVVRPSPFFVPCGRRWIPGGPHSASERSSGTVTSPIRLETTAMLAPTVSFPP